ncbi:MAG: BlaI/MecI/CopY family transcriptional regulator [Candidatus Moranbacteria bacterium]|jgi:sugar-specific transcriptional regulator TrmB|nr:BlaI/MecI/CopY family transcriptional regulator [Candidatus Moranbacteria bacterium]
MINDKLKALGLSDKEIKTYLALLELGEATVAEVAKKAEIKRTTTYLTVESLVEKGLVSGLRKKKKQYYSAEDPRLLGAKMDEKKKMLEQAIPELLAIANFLDKKPKITFYEGMEGIKSVYRDTLLYPDQEMLAWVSEEAFHFLDEDFVNYYIPERVSKKIWVKVIAPDTPEIREYRKNDQKTLKQTRLISSTEFPVKVEIDLYGKNRIGIMAFEEKIGLIIESEKIYTTLKSIFLMNWSSLEK